MKIILKWLVLTHLTVFNEMLSIGYLKAVLIQYHFPMESRFGINSPEAVSLWGSAGRLRVPAASPHPLCLSTEGTFVSHGDEAKPLGDFYAH